MDAISCSNDGMRGFNRMRTGGIIKLWLLMFGLTLTLGYTPILAREHMVVPTSAIVPPTFTPVVSPTGVVATSTVVGATSTVVAGGNVSATQTAAAQSATATVAQTVGATNTAIVIVVTSTPVATASQPGRLPNTGVVDGVEVWQNQPLVLVMAVTGVLGLVFLFYGQRQ